MKKTTIKTKLVLHKETTRALLEKEFAEAVAGQGNNGDASTPVLTCVAGAPGLK